MTLFTIHFATINTEIPMYGKASAGKFTIHFATINTSNKCSKKFYSSLFTIHFATINTALTTHVHGGITKFTIHFATINTGDRRKLQVFISYLQYTLLLLIRFSAFSVNSSHIYLQYTLLLLIQETEENYKYLFLIYNTLCYY